MHGPDPPCRAKHWSKSQAETRLPMRLPSPLSSTRTGDGVVPEGLELVGEAKFFSFLGKVTPCPMSWKTGHKCSGRGPALI